MKFEQALNLIQEQNILYCKIEDYNKKRVLYLEAETAPQLVSKLQSYRDSLSHLGKVVFICANEKIKAGSWKDALNWQVTINENVPQTNLPVQTGVVPAGYISAHEAGLMAQLSEMKMKFDLQKQIDELKHSTNKTPSTADEIFKFMPILGLVLDIDEKKMTQMMGLATLQHAMNNPGSHTSQAGGGINGLQEKKAEAVKIETTEEEDQMLDKIEDSMLSLMEKIPKEDLLKFLDKLNEKPELAATLKTFL